MCTELRFGDISPVGVVTRNGLKLKPKTWLIPRMSSSSKSILAYLLRNESGFGKAQIDHTNIFGAQLNQVERVFIEYSSVSKPDTIFSTRHQLLMKSSLFACLSHFPEYQ